MPAEVRALKLAEEMGEAGEALFGMRTVNKRELVCRTRDDLLDEPADVIITTAVAICAVTDGEAEDARSHFEQRLQVITARTTGP